MRKTKSEAGGRYIGIVVNCTDDPKKMGRCRVMIPQLHAPHLEESKMPWMQLASNANDDGQFSFDRPPQVGATVMVYYPPGSKSSGFGIIENVLNGVHDPKALEGNISLDKLGWVIAAYEAIHDMFGPPDVQQTTTTNDTGKEQVTTTISNTRDAPSIKGKLRIPSNFAFESIVKFYNELEDVATAVQDSAASMTTDLAALLPGENFSLSGLLSLFDDDQIEQLESSMGEAYGAMQSILSNIGTDSPLSGTNFTQTANRMNPATFASNAIAALRNAIDLKSVDETLKSLLTDRTIRGIDELEDVATEVATAFGNLDITLSANGNISTSVSDSLQTLISAFESFAGGIENSVGTMLSKSDITTDGYKRLSTEVQTEFKEFLESASVIKDATAALKEV